MYVYGAVDELYQKIAHLPILKLFFSIRSIQLNTVHTFVWKLLHLPLEMWFMVAWDTVVHVMRVKYRGGFQFSTDQA